MCITNTIRSVDEHGSTASFSNIIHWFRLFLAKSRVRVRVRVTSPGFATPGSMRCAVQVWSGRWTVVKCAVQTWLRRGPGRDNARAVLLWCRPTGVKIPMRSTGCVVPPHALQSSQTFRRRASEATKSLSGSLLSRSTVVLFKISLQIVLTSSFACLRRRKKNYPNEG